MTDKKEIIQFKKAFFEVMYGYSQNTFDKTMKGKNSPSEVLDEDWQNCSFTFEEAWQKIEDKLKKK